VEKIDEREWDRVCDRSAAVKTPKTPKKSGRGKNGINTKLVSEGGKLGCFIKFTIWVTSTRKYKQAWQREGVIIRALSAQDYQRATYRSLGLLGVEAGDLLQIQHRAVGFGYEAINVRTKESGLVKISALVMSEYNEPDEEFEDWTGDSWSPVSNATSSADAIQRAAILDPSYVPPHARRGPSASM
jgi:hypothetical protein